MHDLLILSIFGLLIQVTLKVGFDEISRQQLLNLLALIIPTSTFYRRSEAFFSEEEPHDFGLKKKFSETKRKFFKNCVSNHVKDIKQLNIGALMSECCRVEQNSTQLFFKTQSI